MQPPSRGSEHRSSEDTLSVKEIAPLLTALRSPAQSVRIAALRALVRLPLATESWIFISRYILSLLSLRAGEEEVDTYSVPRDELIQAAAYVPTKAVRRRLEEIAHEGSEEDRQLAGWLLVPENPDQRDIPRLVEDLNSPEPEVRASAASRLSFLDVSAVKRTIRARCRKDDYGEVRFWLALALARLGEIRCLRTVLKEVNRGTLEVPSFHGNPMALGEDIAARGPFPEETVSFFRELAEEDGYHDTSAERNSVARRLTRRLAGDGGYGGEYSLMAQHILLALPEAAGDGGDAGEQPVFGQPQAPERDPNSERRAAELADRYLETLRSGEFQEIAWEDLESLSYMEPGRATSLVTALWDHLTSNIPTEDYGQRILLGNRIVELVGYLRHPFVPDITSLFEHYLRIYDDGEHDSRLQLAWTVSRAGARWLLAGLTTVLVRGEERERAAAAALIEEAAALLSVATPPLLGAGPLVGTMPHNVDVVISGIDVDRIEATIDAEPFDVDAVLQGLAHLMETTDRTRYVNAWFEGHPGPEHPLGYGRTYELAIQIAPDLLPGSFTKDRPEFSEPDFAGEETIDIVVAVVSDDFEVLGRPTARIALPRDRSKPSTIAFFRVQPLKNNQDVSISVLFYRENSLFHEASVGARVQVLEVDEQAEASSSSHFPTKEVLRRPVQGPRDLNLQIIGHEGGYRLVVFYDSGDSDPEVMWCKIPVTPERVTDLVEGARDRLLKVVHAEGTLADGAHGRIFFDGEPKEAAGREGRLPKLLTIEDGIYRDALQSLAQAGRLLYVNIFNSAGGTKVERNRAAQVGDSLRRLSRGRPLRVQVLSDDFFMPWNLLYDGNYPSGEIDPGEFWGFKHTIEEIPYQTSEEAPAVVPAEAFGIGMNLNQVNLPRELIEPQVAEVEKLAPGVSSDLRYTEEEVQEALQGQRAQHPVEYFYCHAGARGERDADFDQSYLGLTDAESGLTLESIKLATAGQRFTGQPLFFLNACESAQMDGRFYDGFVPNFLTMGASGIVGTDCEVPSLFAAHLGMGCLEAFFGGETVGNSLLSARKDMLERYRNPLGLIYRVFGNSDLRLSRPVLETREE